jgi:hypothetical protein
MFVTATKSGKLQNESEACEHFFDGVITAIYEEK